VTPNFDPTITLEDEVGFHAHREIFERISMLHVAFSRENRLQ
jgi:hypothetical protein